MLNNDITGCETMWDCMASILMDCPFNNYKVIATYNSLFFVIGWLQKQKDT